MRDSNTIPTAIPTFRGLATQLEWRKYCPTSAEHEIKDGGRSPEVHTK
jgi:hypothetical protein